MVQMLIGPYSSKYTYITKLYAVNIFVHVNTGNLYGDTVNVALFYHWIILYESCTRPHVRVNNPIGFWSEYMQVSTVQRVYLSPVSRGDLGYGLVEGRIDSHFINTAGRHIKLDLLSILVSKQEPKLGTGSFFRTPVLTSDCHLALFKPLQRS